MKFRTEIIHGQEVTVRVFEEEVKPTIASGRYSEELVNCSADRVAEIGQIAEKYKEDLLKVVLLDDEDEGDFLMLEEDDCLEDEGYGIEESYKPLDQLFAEVSFDDIEEEDED